MPERASRIAVLSKTLAFAMAYVLAIVLFHRFYLAARIASRQMSVAMAIAFVQCAAITAMLSFSFFLKLVRQLRTSRATRVKPRIRELLAVHAAGTDRGGEIRRHWDINPREVEECLVEFLRMVRGLGRETLSQLAADLHLIEKWQRQYRSRSTGKRKDAVAHLALISRRLAGKVLRAALLDRDESVRLHTARVMIGNSDPEELAQAFGLAVNGSLVTRMVLAEDLRPHALDLAKDTIPAVLACGASEPTLAALEIVRAWNRFVPLPEVYALLRHPNPAVRSAALGVLPLAPRSPHLETEILEALNSPVEEVRSAAAKIAAIMGVREALPLLASCLHEAHEQTAGAAAYALSQLGPDGCRILEQEMLGGSPLAASVALEALERIRISPRQTVVA
jgi:hypothetical protein